MRELNRNKSINGNSFQNMLFETYINTYRNKTYCKNNNTYSIPELGRKISDIELELSSHEDIRIIFEITTSLRDDRYWAKEIQAKLIKDALKKENKNCIYILVLPDDTYYAENSREPKNNKHFENLINNELSKRNGIGFIDLFLRESDISNFLEFVDNCKYQIPSKIIQNYKKN